MILPSLTILCLLTSLINCRQIEFDHDSKVIQLQLLKPADRSLQKRSKSFESKLNPQDYFYTVELGVGTPSQKINCIFDTGSSDLWVPAKSNPFCLGNKLDTNGTNEFHGTEITPILDCDKIGVFDPGSSYSLSATGYNFSTQYFDGSYSDGFWVVDDISIADQQVPDLQFAVANISSAPSGVLGVGLPRLEAVRGYDGAPNANYDNFPQTLKSNRLINRVLYSLYFDSGDLESGTVLFGGIDEKKYDGVLYTLPLVNIYEQIDEPAAFDITLQGLGIRSESNCKDTVIAHKKAPALLDSGSTIMGAPQEALESIAQELGAAFSESDGLYVLDCPASNDDRTFYFDFGELKLKVPIHDLLYLPESGQNYCGLAIIASGEEWILGDLVLKSAYVVYDLDNLEISIAQVKTTSGSRIQTVSATGSLPQTRKSNSTPWSLSGSTNSSTDSVFDKPLPKKCQKSPSKTCPAKKKGNKREVLINIHDNLIMLENSGSSSLRPSYLLCALLVLFHSLL
ncbi:aspartyl protease BAR1 [Kluyveromyces lactis]|uniref:KLLA0D15917p n=1 Tax=Kluyveromyces lactis (strain ATCC 8585 / CBS 2359 / DSM 70799 / NBRC 1267 / NRRL Y-1140 / WM37) TaxID=284590 RepID=Q6CQM8_KLULA|nr:uncharacterized protein KLLA0_D15917g [Kluyveromyces lactis]CAH00857.1 KLLA0D15917p [Kluyveromyces lactis]|eukprot:XP_453761.1 uncharacterized protein KLLA0_D15917g [Kluyveromyces lactis]